MGVIAKLFSIRLVVGAFIAAAILGALAGALWKPLGVAVTIILFFGIWVGGAANTDNPMRCPHCRKRVKMGATVCHHCGRDARQAATS